MGNVGTIALATYAELARRPIYYITLFAFALLIFCSSFLTQFTFFQEANMVREMGLASIALWGFVIVVTMTGVLVTQELEDRTAITLLSKPLRRSAFLLGKYFGILLALAAGMTVLAGILFFTLWWMAQESFMGDSTLVSPCLLPGVPLFLGGLIGWFVLADRIRQAEAATAVSAPRGAARLALVAVVAGIVLLVLAAEFSRGKPGAPAVIHQRLLRDHPEFAKLSATIGDPGTTVAARRAAARRISEIAPSTSWDFVRSFMTRGGTIVFQGALLCFLQVAVLCAICVSVAAFTPPVVSVATTTLAFLIGNLSNYMLASVERIDVGAVSAAGRGLYYLLPNLAYYNLQTHFSEGRIISLEYLLLAILHASAYSALAFTISCSLFERREIR